MSSKLPLSTIIAFRFGQVLAIYGLSASVLLATQGKSVPSADLVARCLALCDTVKDATQAAKLRFDITEAQFDLGDEPGMLATLKKLPDSLRDDIVARWILTHVKEEAPDRIRARIAAISTPAQRSIAAWRCAIVLEKMGKPAIAEQLVGDIAIPLWKIRGWLNLAEERARVGNRVVAGKAIDRIKKLLPESPDARISLDAWIGIAKVQSALGDKQEADRSFQRAFRAIDQFEEISRPYGLMDLAAARAQTGEFGEAWRVQRLIGDERNPFGTRLQDMTSRAIVQSLARSGKWEEAELALKQIVGRPERAFALAQLAEIKIEHGRAANARRYLQQARPFLENSEEERRLAVAALVKCWISLEEFGEAASLANLLGDAIGAELSGDIARALCHAGDIKAALKTFDSIQGPKKAVAAGKIAEERTIRQDPATQAWADSLLSPEEKISAYLGILAGRKASRK
jgi:tetratricopeptide (TPR) repeat protein